jgi:LmbE family N-acetylglucosaminyl deacetylase
MFADKSLCHLARSLALALLATTLAAQTSSSRAQQEQAVLQPQGYTLEPATVDLVRPPLQQDTGRAAFDQLLRKLKTTARLMHVVAHPDDEDGGLLTLQSRGRGATTLLFTLTRGEGGQNKTGSNLFDELGVLRTLELLESDRYYGVDQRFSRAADFGFSKSAQEALQKWAQQDVASGSLPRDENNPALADLVRAIRIFRPDVLTSRFQGTPSDRHGHHQAAGLLTREAFKAAGDPKRFPEQIAEGLLPWQPVKVYAATRDSSDFNVEFDTGTRDDALGMSYAELAMQGLRHQESQGAADWTVSPGPHWTRYQLKDKVEHLNTAAKEQDFFDGIDVSLPFLFQRLDANDQQSLPWLKDALTEIARRINAASKEKDIVNAAKPLLTAATQMDSVFRLLEAAKLSGPGRELLLAHLRDKRQQLNEAANLALGITLEARVGRPDAPVPNEKDARVQYSPRDKVFVVAHVHNGSKYPIQVSGFGLSVPASWIAQSYVGENRIVEPGEDLFANFSVVIGGEAKFTRPIYTRNNPETDTVWNVIPGAPVTRPLPPTPITAAATYSLYKAPGDWTFRIFGASTAKSPGKLNLPGASIAAPLTVAYTNGKSEQRTRPLAIAPSYSVLMEPASQVIPASSNETRQVTVNISTIERLPSSGEVSLEAPEGWRVEPASQKLSFDNAHRQRKATFTVTPANHDPGRHELRATLNSGGKPYKEGYTTVTRDDLGAFYYYQPAVQRISVVDVKVPTTLKVGYIMGAGDDIPTVLRQLGFNVELLTPEQVASADLKQFDTIVLGIRAYDTREDVRKNNARLLDFARDGGTLIVQYNADWSEFNAGNYTPYPASLSRDRVSVEDAPVQILAPDDSIFRSPNAISQRDFEGWVQERGLYFMSDFDKQYTPLLSSNDPSEPARNGGLLRAKYGKGTYIYTGYAFFRQLPNGVPGAIRLFVNLIAAGHP